MSDIEIPTTFAPTEEKTRVPVDVRSRFRVAEIFGPTIQGEGALAGATTHFVRFGGCDYRCVWCDSLHAVLPEEVAKLDQLTLDEVAARVYELPAAEWVTLSGGNPALLNLGPLVGALQGEGYKVAVETQGSVWKDWLGAVDLLTVSPKPPSSEMTSPARDEEVDSFVGRAFMAMPGDRLCLKIVVFDEDDFLWARDVLYKFASIPSYMSAGTPRAPMTLPGDEIDSTAETREQVCEKYAWLCERLVQERDLTHVRVLPQLHVLAFGHKVGV